MELHKVKPIIIITKTDLVDDMSKFEEIFNYYRNIGELCLYMDKEVISDNLNINYDYVINKFILLK